LKRLSALIAIKQLRAGDWALIAAAGAVLIAGAIRYAQQPTFWLDEAFIAVSLRDPSPRTIFAPLEYNQYFPRVYLSCIAFLRHIAGYDIWVLRLLPFISFVVATSLWTRLLAKRTAGILSISLLGAGLLLGAGYWLDQANQLKQYTFDVMLAMIPFLLPDKVLDEALVEAKRRGVLVLLVVPLALSYSYPIALGARVLGWYVGRARAGSWRLSIPAVLMMAGLAGAAMTAIWATDYRFNHEFAAYVGYWDSCILGSQHSISATLRLLAKFFWGWHGQMPLVTAFVAPLQVLGVCRVIAGTKSTSVIASDAAWGTRSLGSVFVLGGLIVASLLVYFPICAGRVVLFAQVHTQLLAIEGALWVLGRVKQQAATAAIVVFSGVAIVYGVRTWLRFVRAEPAENLRPVVSLISNDVANTVWVHPCSVAQARSLPEPLPVVTVVFGSETETPKPGERVWILWTHLGEGSCVRQLEQVRLRARTWKIVYNGPDSSLALAEF
jgi:hypothetical protein